MSQTNTKFMNVKVGCDPNDNDNQKNSWGNKFFRHRIKRCLTKKYEQNNIYTFKALEKISKEQLKKMGFNILEINWSMQCIQAKDQDSNLFNQKIKQNKSNLFTHRVKKYLKSRSIITETYLIVFLKHKDCKKDAKNHLKEEFELLYLHFVGTLPNKDKVRQEDLPYNPPNELVTFPHESDEFTFGDGSFTKTVCGIHSTGRSRTRSRSSILCNRSVERNESSHDSACLFQENMLPEIQDIKHPCDYSPDPNNSSRS